MQKIMFNDRYGLTQAVLEGRKTMTRRIVPESTLRKANLMVKICGCSVEDAIIDQTPYCFSEKIAVAQSYETILDKMIKSKGGYGEEENEFYEIHKDTPGWKNKMFVKAYLMPQIRITDIKVERLQDISDEDCMKEGVTNYKAHKYSVFGLKYEQTKRTRAFNCPRQAFAVLIDKVSGKGTWSRNPFVFAYSFKLVK